MPSDLYSHVLEIHAHGLSWQRNWDEAVVIWNQLIDEYYPNSITGVAAAMSKATYLAFGARDKKRDFKTAVEIFKDILEKAPYDDMVPHVKRLLAKIYIIRGQIEPGLYDEAILLLNDVIQRVGPNPEGAMKECLRSAEALLKTAEAKKSERNSQSTFR